VGLDSVFENDKEDLAGKKVVLCGYGSGSHAVIQANLVPEGYRANAKKLDFMKRLGGRRKFSVEDYEKIHKGEISPSEWPAGASKRFVLKNIGKGGTRAEGDRDYALAS